MSKAEKNASSRIQTGDLSITRPASYHWTVARVETLLLKCREIRHFFYKGRQQGLKNNIKKKKKKKKKTVGYLNYYLHWSLKWWFTQKLLTSTK